MKKLLSVLLLAFLAIHLIGCSSNGLGSGVTTDSTIASLSDSDLAAAEAGLIASRILAADSAPSISGSVLADTQEALPEFQYKGRRYRGGRSGDDWKMRGPDGTCEMEMERPASGPMRLRVGLISCEITETAEGNYQITWPDGQVVTIEKPAGDSSTGEIIIRDITWTYAFSDNSLLTLQNSVNGRTLQITEDDTGVLKIIPDQGTPRWARWNQSGEIEGEFVANRGPYRFRGGHFQ